MNNQKLLDQIISQNETWYQMFDMIRIIEPGGTHQVISSDGRDCLDLGDSCYKLWEREDQCTNCVCKKAYIEQTAFMKIEYRQEQYFLVVAKAITLKGKDYILELVMNISKQMTDEEDDMVLRKFVLDIVNKLETVSEKETFTNLYNKTHMMQVYEQQKSESQKLYMALIDIDHFKLINDTYGHDLGDQAILTISREIQERIPKEEGMVARFGGDEFGIIFFHDQIELYREILHETKQILDHVTYESEGVHFHITVSFGIAEVSKAENFAEAIHKVDKELYDAKRRKTLEQHIIKHY